MSLLVILAIVIVVLLVVVLVRRGGGQRQQGQLDDARAEAQRWYERLGGQVLNLHADEPGARQALADASERYNAAGGQLQQANTVRQFELARESALEGLNYVRAARTAMGLDPGPELPPLNSARGAGQVTRERDVDFQGQHYRMGPQYGSGTPYFYPGGYVQGRPVPGGWYSTPVWKTALGAGVGVIGGMLLFDALFEPGFDSGYGNGFDSAGDFGGNDGNNFGDFGGNDGGGNDGGGGYDGGADYDAGGGGFDGGDFGGGDFGGDF